MLRRELVWSKKYNIQIVNVLFLNKLKLFKLEIDIKIKLIFALKFVQLFDFIYNFAISKIKNFSVEELTIINNI